MHLLSLNFVGFTPGLASTQLKSPTHSASLRFARDGLNLKGWHIKNRCAGCESEHTLAEARLNNKLAPNTYKALLQFIETGINLIKAGQNKEAARHFINPREIAKTGVKLVLTTENFDQPMNSVLEAELISARQNQHENPTPDKSEVHLTTFQFKQPHVTPQQKKSLIALQHAEAYAGLEEWLHSIQSVSNHFLSQKFRKVHYKTDYTIDKEKTTYTGESLAGIDARQIVEADIAMFMAENQIPLPKNFLEEQENGYKRLHFKPNEPYRWSELSYLYGRKSIRRIEAELGNMKTGDVKIIGPEGDIPLRFPREWHASDQCIRLEKTSSDNYRLDYKGSEPLSIPIVVHARSESQAVPPSPKEFLPGESIDIRSGSKLFIGNPDTHIGFSLP